MQAGDDEARVGPIGPGLDAGDDALNAVPACSTVIELGEAAELGAAVRDGKAGSGAAFQALDMTAERAGGRDTEQMAVCDLDLTDLQAIDLPRGFGRD